jgi:hypothetical protein
MDFIESEIDRLQKLEKENKLTEADINIYDELINKYNTTRAKIENDELINKLFNESVR